MTIRRRDLLPLFAMLVSVAPLGAATAQEAPPATTAARSGAGEAPVAGAPRTDAKPRQARRRAARSRREPAGNAQPPPPQQQAAAETGPRLEAAPVPNRELEAPRAPVTDRTRLSPSVIHRPLPGQGMAAEGAQNIQEERLFFPAPGARLNVPFAY
jgi:hypothetical protein